MLGYNESHALGSNAIYCYKKCSKIIKNFLEQNGGSDNGYDTFASGTVRQNVHDTIDWKTPKSQELTGLVVGDRGAQLYDELRDIVEEFDIETMEIISEHTEYGCFDTYISFPSYLKVDL